MNELMTSYSAIEQAEIKQFLRKLFVLQDKPAGDDKVNTFYEEICERGCPAGAVLAGLKQLCGENMQQVKLGTILDAIREKIYVEDPAPGNYCKYCDGVGMVPMSDEKGYSFVFACICARGDHFLKSMNLARWNRGITQEHNRKIYKLGQKSLVDMLNAE